MQAPEHVIDNERAKAKAAAKNAAMSEEKRAKRGSKAQLKKPPEGTVVWTEQTFDKLVDGVPEPLVSRMKVDNAMLVNVLSREEDAFPVLRRLTHRQPRGPRAASCGSPAGRSGSPGACWPPAYSPGSTSPTRFGRRYVHDRRRCPTDFALNQPLSHFALAALDVLDPESETYTLDVRLGGRGGAGGAAASCCTPSSTPPAARRSPRSRPTGVEYDERMALIEDVTWPQPLAELLEPLYETYRERHPWLSPDALAPKSVVREMWEQGMGFTDLVGRYQLARSEGLVLRYLTDAYRALRQTVPTSHRTAELDDCSSTGWGRRCARSTPRCSTSGRRSRTPITLPARCWTTRRHRRPARSASRAGCST